MTEKESRRDLKPFGPTVFDVFTIPLDTENFATPRDHGADADTSTVIFNTFAKAGENSTGPLTRSPDLTLPKSPS